MTNTEAMRVLSALLKQQEELPPEYRDLGNREMLALGKAVKVLRRYQDITTSQKEGKS